MKITNVKTFICDGGFRPWTFVKIETDEGLVGWGDCIDWGAAPAVAAAVELYAQYVIGRDPHEVESIWGWRVSGVAPAASRIIIRNAGTSSLADSTYTSNLERTLQR